MYSLRTLSQFELGSQIYQTPLLVMLQLYRVNFSSVVLVVNMLDKKVVSSSVIGICQIRKTLSVVLKYRTSVICLIPSAVSGEKRSHSSNIVLLVIRVSDKMDTQLLFNGVFNTSSLHTVHLLRLLIIATVLSGCEERRQIHFFSVCGFLVNILITSSHCTTVGEWRLTKSSYLFHSTLPISPIIKQS